MTPAIRFLLPPDRCPPRRSDVRGTADRSHPPGENDGRKAGSSPACVGRQPASDGWNNNFSRANPEARKIAASLIAGEMRVNVFAGGFAVLRAGRPQDSRRDAGATESRAARRWFHDAFLGGGTLLPLLQFSWLVGERVGCRGVGFPCGCVGAGGGVHTKIPDV